MNTSLRQLPGCIAKAIVFLVSSCVMFSSVHQSAYAFPEKPLTIVVGFPAGGAFDSVMRALAEEMSKTLGQRVNVDNRAGAGGAIGTQALIAAPADGHTLLAAGLQLATGPHLNKVSYSPKSDLTMVGQVANVPVLLLVKADSPIRDAKDVIALAKRNGNGVTIGSGGSGTTGHFGALMVESGLRVKVVHVPFKGGAPGLLALAGGELDLMFDQPSGALQGLIKAGRVRAIAVMQGQRHPLMPHVQSAAEFGLPMEFPLRGWQGIAVRSGTSPAVVQQLSAALAAAVVSPTFQKRLEQLDLDTVTKSTPDEFQKLYLAELARWGAFIKQNRITVE